MFDFITNKFSSIFSRFSGTKKITEKGIQETLISVKDALLEADVPYDVVEAFSTELSKQVVGQKLHKSLNPSEQFSKLVRDTMLTFMGQNSEFIVQIPSTIMVMGLQGSGKTTSIAKLARYIIKDAKKRGKKRRLLLASVDFYRPAAVDQLEQLAKQISVPFYRAQSTDPVLAAKEIQEHAKQKSCDIVLLDTAGRLHVDTVMLKELQDIKDSVNPKHKLLVLDAMTGQESLAVAKSFDEAIGFHAAILTKMDSDTRGGAAFAFRYALKKPIAFVGVGEKTIDLQVFHSERAVGRMLGEGDLQTLVEKADEKIKESEQKRAQKAFMSGNFSLEDFAQQMDMMNRLGSLSSIMKYMPGMGSAQIPSDALEKGESEMKRFRAIINSMTSKEKVMVHEINGSRKKRIALGAGVKEGDVAVLLERFKQAQQYVKLFKKSGLLKGMFR